MKLSTLFTKTSKTAPADEQSKNAQLLIRAGYVHKEIAGVYSYLPLGLRVLENIKSIVREEIDAIGGQELLMSTLQRHEIWEVSDRWDAKKMDIWFKTNLAAGGELGLAPTHEEPVTDMLCRYITSYKDLPLYVYQFQTKFRNELRAKSGIMRGREFLMKDLYSFSRTKEEHDAFYERASAAYTKIYDRLGLGTDTYKTFASGGVFSKYSHEYQTLLDVGEDTVYINSDKSLAINQEVFNDEVLAEFGAKKEDFTPHTASEVGNIFTLGYKYSEPIGLEFTDQDGASANPTIIAILAALLLPALQSARAAAMGVKCANNYKTLSAYFQFFVDENRGRYPGNGGADATDTAKQNKHWLDVMNASVLHDPGAFGRFGADKNVLGNYWEATHANVGPKDGQVMCPTFVPPMYAENGTSRIYARSLGINIDLVSDQYYDPEIAGRSGVPVYEKDKLDYEGTIPDGFVNLSLGRAQSRYRAASRKILAGDIEVGNNPQILQPATSNGVRHNHAQWCEQGRNVPRFTFGVPLMYRGYPIFRNNGVDAMTTGGGGLAFRHQNKTSLVFIDGHVENPSYTEEDRLAPPAAYSFRD